MAAPPLGHQGLGRYVYFTPLGELPPPQWPDMSPRVPRSPSQYFIETATTWSCRLRGR
ncbi:MAG: hypothetical protein WKF75_11330 [Singulisphaera sp.]